jgi:hypothetical protein
MTWRPKIDQVVRDNPAIEFVVVHHADGSNDFFSHIPDLEVCQRHRVAGTLRDIADNLESSRQRQRGPGPQSCPGQEASTSKAKGCPA